MKKFFKPLNILLILVLLVNIFLLTNYRKENIDEPWVLSFYYNFVNHGVSTDNVFLGNEGQIGVQHFGKTTAYLYGSVLNVLGWTRFNASLISLTLLLIAIWIWYKNVLMISDKNRIFAKITAILMLTIEAFVAIANSPRNEALVFLIAALVFYFYLKQKHFLAAVIFAMSLEIHPVAIVATVPIIAHYFCFKEKPPKGIIWKTTAAFVIAALYYLALHHAELGTLTSVLSSATKTAWSNLFDRCLCRCQRL